MNLHRQTNERGFTLVEVLIALFIFSLISVGATTALTSSLRGQAQMSERLDDISDLDTMRGLIKSDMASLTLQQRRDPFGGYEPYVLQADGQVLFDFTRSGRSNPLGDPRGDLQHITYLFEDGALIRRSFAQMNPAPQSTYVDRVLLNGLSKLDLGFLTFASDLGLTTERDDVRLAADQPSDFLNVLKLDMEFETGETLTQYFEVGS